MLRAALACALLISLLVASAEAGVLDAAWIAPTTNTDGSALADLASYRVYFTTAPTAPCPGTQFFTVPSPTAAPAPNTSVTFTLTGLTAAAVYEVSVTAIDTSGLESGCSVIAIASARSDPPPPPPPPPPPSTVTFGETVALTDRDCCNANLLIAQKAALATQGRLTSLSFFVTTADGSLRLGVYADSGGSPGAKLAETAAFTPVAGWNTAPVITSPTLAAGTYWLAYLPSSAVLSFSVDRTSGTHKFVAFTFGVMPTTFPTAGVTTAPAHWSLFGTVATGSSGSAPSPATNLRIQFGR